MIIEDDVGAAIRLLGLTSTCKGCAMELETLCEVSYN